jgi:hypothetical protein
MHTEATAHLNKQTETNQTMDAAAGGTLRKRPAMSVHTESNGSATTGGEASSGMVVKAQQELGEPVSPSARLVEDFYIVVVMGIGTPINLPVARAGIEAQLARYPRFRSIQVQTVRTLTASWKM